MISIERKTSSITSVGDSKEYFCRSTKKPWRFCVLARKNMKQERTIESAAQTDFLEIVDIWEASVRATHTFLSEPDIQELRPLILNEYLMAVTLFCVREDGKILGFLGLSPTRSKCSSSGLTPAARESANNLFASPSTKKASAKSMSTNKTQAVGFYEHLGFATGGRSPLDPQGKLFPVLSMERKT